MPVKLFSIRPEESLDAFESRINQWLAGQAPNTPPGQPPVDIALLSVSAYFSPVGDPGEEGSGRRLYVAVGYA